MGERGGLEKGKVRRGWRGRVRRGKERWVGGVGGGALFKPCSSSIIT